MASKRHTGAETGRQYNARILREHIMEIMEKLETWHKKEREDANKRSKKEEVDHNQDASDRSAMVENKPQATSTTVDRRNDTNRNESNNGNDTTADGDFNYHGAMTNEGMSQKDQARVSHQSIVDELYCNVCRLYQFHHPESWPLEDVRFPEVIDYQSLAVAQAAKDCMITCHDDQDIRKPNKTCTMAIRKYHSRAFPMDFERFCVSVADSIQKARSDEVEAAKNIPVRKIPEENE